MAIEWDAKTYDRIANLQTNFAEEVVERFIDFAGNVLARAHVRVLDAGCGTGRATEMLLERFPEMKVVALDGSRDQVDGARARLARFGERVEYVHADLSQPLAGFEPVDAIFTTAALHWITDHAALFRNFAAVCQPRAVFCGQWGGVGNISTVTAVLDRERVPWRRTKYFATVDDTVAAMTAAGWDVQYCDLQPITVQFEDDRAVEEMLRTVILLPELMGMDDEAGNALVAKVLQATREAGARYNLSNVMEYVGINVVATRGDGGLGR